MQKLSILAAVAMLATAMPVSADATLFEKNYNVLINMLPEGSVLEVQVVENGEWVTQVWTAEQFATFRATAAAAIGRDYTAGAEGLPADSGDRQEVGDIFMDLWGTTRVNVKTPRGLPTTIPLDDKLWFYGGSGSTVGAFENANVCFFGFICSFSYYWTATQDGAVHGDSWFAGSGVVFIFPAPFGALAAIDGVEFSDNL